MSKGAESRIVGRKQASATPFDAVIAAHADALTRQLERAGERFAPPPSRRELRRFPTGEAARLIGITDAYLRQLILSDEALEPEKGPAGRRQFTLEQINDLRRRLARTRPGYLRHRRDAEHLQVLAVTTVKGRSGKTTAAAHLAQYLALQGFRVLAVDLDPQAALSGLFGCRPELDVGVSQTLYGAVRRDGAERPLRAILRPTHFPGIDLVPGHLELMACEHGAVPESLVGRVAEALAGIADDYDVVVVDCSAQLGGLTLGALCAATGILVTVQPQMLDLAGMSGSLRMTADLLGAVRAAGGDLRHDFLRYLVTRYEPHDGPQTQVVGLLRSLFGEQVMTHAVPLSAAIAESGASGRTLYEAGRESFTRQSLPRQTYDRTVEALDAVNAEITGQIAQAWGRAA